MLPTFSLYQMLEKFLPQFGESQDLANLIGYKITLDNVEESNLLNHLYAYKLLAEQSNSNEKKQNTDIGQLMQAISQLNILDQFLDIKFRLLEVQLECVNDSWLLLRQNCSLPDLTKSQNILQNKYKMRLIMTIRDIVNDYKKLLDTRESLIKEGSVIFLSSSSAKNKEVQQFCKYLLQDAQIIINHRKWQIPRDQAAVDTTSNEKDLEKCHIAEARLQVLAVLGRLMQALESCGKNKIISESVANKLGRSMNNYQEHVKHYQTARAQITSSLSISSFELINHSFYRSEILTEQQIWELIRSSAEIKLQISQLEQDILNNIHSSLLDQISMENTEEVEHDQKAILPMMIEYLTTATPAELKIILDNFSDERVVETAVVNNENADYGCLLKVAMRTKETRALHIIEQKAPQLYFSVMQNLNVSKDFTTKNDIDSIRAAIINPNTSQEVLKGIINDTKNTPNLRALFRCYESNINLVILDIATADMVEAILYEDQTINSGSKKFTM